MSSEQRPEDLAGVLVSCAEAMDARDFDRALGVILNAPLDPKAAALSDLAMDHWRRAASDIPSKGLALAHLKTIALAEGPDALERLLEDTAGSADLTAAAIAISCTKGLSLADGTTRLAALQRMDAAGVSDRFMTLWDSCLGDDIPIAPSWWAYQSALRNAKETGSGTPFDRVRAAVPESQSDLLGLLQVYERLISPGGTAVATDLARQLTTPVYRQLAAEAIVLRPLSLADLTQAIQNVTRAMPDAAPDALAFARLRQSVAQKDWPQVIEASVPFLRRSDHRAEALCLRALALGHLGRTDEMQEALEFIAGSASAPWFAKGRAKHVAAVVQRHASGQIPFEDAPMPPLRAPVGRPLVQGLWVGPRLRWVEQMSIRSFLRNGWRYQLYVYDIPEGVPEGVELMDASVVLPRKTLFREGGQSGIHRGSLGAFSDLFRYALLEMRGGLWADTDVVNLKAFEPEGQRFICSELTDAGLVFANGAMMASPAHDPFVQSALDRAQRLRARPSAGFASLGPDVLAEMIGQFGFEDITVHPPGFLNPVGWMNVPRLFAPPQALAADLIAQEAVNCHLHTETWRVSGFDLSAAPPAGTFLAALKSAVEADDAPPLPDTLKRLAECA